MKTIKIRYPKMSDAKDLLEIFNNPKFYFWRKLPKTLAQEQSRIQQQALARKKNIERNFIILYDKKVAGVIGIKVYQHRIYCGEIGYFLNPEVQGHGVVTKAVKLIEQNLVKKLGLRRIEILTGAHNIASQKVALHNKYKNEGLLRGVFLMPDGSMKDAYIFAKSF